MLVIYHDNCYDGFTAAWVAKQTYPNADFFGAKYPPAGELTKLPDCRDRTVLMVDFSVARDQMLGINHEAKSFTVLDHHKSAQEACEGLPFCEFDMERSGAGMTWDFLNPGPRPWLVDYVEDRDLWRFSLPNSKQVNAFIQTLEIGQFRVWDELHATPLTAAMNLGIGAEAYLTKSVREMKKEHRVVFLQEYKVPCVNVPYFLSSEVLGQLAEEYGDAYSFALGWFERPDGMIQYSLRSRGDFDVSIVAKEFGGGGHKNAAGFVVSYKAHVGA